MSGQYLKSSEAAKLAKVSRKTIDRKIESNELSWTTKNINGKSVRMVEYESLTRLYPKVRIEGGSKNSSGQVGTSEMSESMDKFFGELDKFREGFENRVKYLEGELRSEKENSQSQVKLLSEGKEQLSTMQLSHEREIHRKNIVIISLSFFAAICLFGMIFFVFNK